MINWTPEEIECLGFDLNYSILDGFVQLEVIEEISMNDIFDKEYDTEINS